jgi:NAD-dependent dihydropyrimidine dehydrogenase PreA subunit
MVVVLAAAAGLIGGWRTALAAATLIILTVGVIFAALPRRPGVRRVGWLTYAAGAVSGAAIGTGVLMLAGGWSSSSQTIVVATSALAMVLLSVDLTGTTPLYPSSVNTRAGTPAITLAEDRCTGAADCVAVCPCDVLRLEPSPVKAVISNPVACTACAACIVQCPEDALFFTYPGGRIVEPTTIRSTRLNLLGDRSIEVPGRST